MNSIKFKTVDQYIKTFPKEIADRLQTVRKTIQQLAPKAEECISYNMPAFKDNGVLIYYAGFKNHIGIYPLPGAIKALGKDLTKYHTAKSTVQFPNSEPLPLTVLKKIVKYRISEKKLEDKQKQEKKK